MPAPPTRLHPLALERRFVASCLLALLVGTASAQTPVAPTAGPALDRPAATDAAGVPRHVRIGLVLSGGGARGGAHLGVLRVLEELQVPVHVIVGTSAGSIVGAAYASGMPLAEIERLMAGLDAASLFRDTVRSQAPLRRKLDDTINYLGPEVGIGPEGVKLPKAAVSGVALEAVLRRLTRIQGIDRFDDLPVRFRAVATDVATGEMVVLDRGDLTRAVRASMAIPAAVNPVEIDGRLLVDGGVVRNLPVDVARAAGADVLIAVNIGTPLLRREQLTSFLGVSDQLTRILTAGNVNRSLSELAAADVLVTPDLGAVTTGDFDKLAEAAEAGEIAARALRARLAELAVDDAAWAAYRLRRARPDAVALPAGEGRPIAAVRVEGTQRVNPEVVIAAMDSAAGVPLQAATVEADMRRIYSSGDFEAVSYRIDDGREGPLLTAQVVEKSWGPTYLRFGLALSTDFAGDAFFKLTATHRSTWLNRLGGEWRNDLTLGREDRLRSEFHQPLSPAQRLFVAVAADLGREPFDVYAEGRRTASFRRAVRLGMLDLGLPLGSVGELRAGVSRGEVRLIAATAGGGISGLGRPASLAGASLRLRLDTLDSLRFPRSGQAAEVEYYRSLPVWGADDAYAKLSAAWRGAVSYGAHTVRAGVEVGGGSRSDSLPSYELYSLGGFLRLSGYRTGELVGRELAFGRLVYNWRITTPGLLDGVFLGVSAEAGRVGNRVRTVDGASTVHGRALYLGADTPLGPVYVGYGRATGGRESLYLFLGQP